MTGYEIKVVIASEVEIKDAIERYYGGGGAGKPVLPRSEKVLQFPNSENTESRPTKDSFQGQVKNILQALLENAVLLQATDIHIEPREASLGVRYRLPNELQQKPDLLTKYQESLTTLIKTLARMDVAEHWIPQDGRFKKEMSQKEFDIRVSVLPTVYGEKIVLRLWDAKEAYPPFDKLGFEQDVKSEYIKSLGAGKGLILIVGPAGSGKTTTLYSTLAYLNKPGLNIFTVEDPLERLLEGINQVQARPHRGLSLSSGLHAVLRQDPDIIMVGDLPDKQTAEAAVEAVERHCLVLSSLPAEDAATAVVRLLELVPQPSRLASALSALVYQQFIRMICLECKETYEMTFRELLSAGLNSRELSRVKEAGSVTLSRGKGCGHCQGTGYKGRVPLYAFYPVSEIIRRLILEKASVDTLRRDGLGRAPLREAAVQKMMKGLTTLEETLKVG